MRVALSLAVALLTTGATPASADVLRPSPMTGLRGQACDWPRSVTAAQKGMKLGPRKLAELPAGRTYLAMVHQVDGCTVPVLASERNRRP